MTRLCKLSKQPISEGVLDSSFFICLTNLTSVTASGEAMSSNTINQHHSHTVTPLANKCSPRHFISIGPGLKDYRGIQKTITEIQKRTSPSIDFLFFNINKTERQVVESPDQELGKQHRQTLTLTASTWTWKDCRCIWWSDYIMFCKRCNRYYLPSSVWHHILHFFFISQLKQKQQWSSKTWTRLLILTVLTCFVVVWHKAVLDLISETTGK